MGIAFWAASFPDNPLLWLRIVLNESDGERLFCLPPEVSGDKMSKNTAGICDLDHTPNGSVI